MSNSSIEKINNKYNFKIEYKLINNKELLKSRLSEIPKSSGCYLFKDIDNNLLYIGKSCLLYTSPSPRDGLLSRMPSSA